VTYHHNEGGLANDFKKKAIKMNARSSIKILELVGKIEDIVKKEFGDTPMNQTKMNIDDNEVTFSFTKKGHKSIIASLPKEKWNQ
jgi:hypothetical protein